MTGQIPDTIRSEDLTYSITGIHPSPQIVKPRSGAAEATGTFAEASGRLFDPAKHGLAVCGLLTACWRGSICHYVVTQGELYLESLIAFVKEQPTTFLGRGPDEWKAPPDYEAIWTVTARVGGPGFQVAFNDLHHRVPFTGEVLAGRRFIDQLYTHMGFQPAWKFLQVRYFEFAEGRLVSQRDRSEEAARFRVLRGDKAETASGDAFSLDFDPWAA